MIQSKMKVGDSMPFKYDKLFDLLQKNGYNTTRIRREHILPEGTLTTMRNHGAISGKTIEKLCMLLNCQPGDFMEYIPSSDKKNSGEHQ